MEGDGNDALPDSFTENAEKISQILNDDDPPTDAPSDTFNITQVSQFRTNEDEETVAPQQQQDQDLVNTKSNENLVFGEESQKTKTQADPDPPPSLSDPQPSEPEISSREESISSAKSEAFQSRYTDEELDQAYNQYLKSKQLPPYMMQHDVVDYARRLSVEALIKEDYDDAAKKEEIANNLVKAISENVGKSDNDYRIKQIEERLELVKQQAVELQQVKQKKVEEIRQDNEKKLQHLEEDHERERNQFFEDHQSSEFLSRFGKPSQKLLELRKIQKTIALAKRFEEAKQIKAEGDRLQQIETKQAEQKARDTIRVLYEQLLDKQEKEKECLEARGKQMIVECEQKIQTELDSNANLEKSLQTKLQELKVGKPQPLPPLASKGKRAPRKHSDRMESEFRRREQKVQLEIQLNDIKGLLRVKRKPRRM